MPPEVIEAGADQGLSTYGRGVYKKSGKNHFCLVEINSIF